MASRIKLRRDIAANWTSTNPILSSGEPGIELDTSKIKFGNGTNAWNSLPYFEPPALLPAGTVSSSTQVDYTQLQNIPIGIVSSSTQVSSWSVATSSVATSASYATTASYVLNPVGVTELVIGDGLNGGTITTTGTVSLNTSSVHFLNGVLSRINTTGVYSSSAQVSYSGLSNIPTGIVSSSGQVTALLPTGTVSSSGQVVALLPVGTVSASSQVSYTGLSNIPSGIVSSSGQVTALLPTGTVSSSGQVTHNSTSGYVANEHINHTTVSISAGLGLTGGGDISATRTITLDTGSAHFITGSTKVIENTKSLTIIDPTATDNVSMFYTKTAITVIELADVIRGTTSVTWNVRYASTRNSGTPTNLFTSDRTTSTVSGTTTTTFNNPNIPAGSWVWIQTSAISGTPNELHVTITYRNT